MLLSIRPRGLIFAQLIGGGELTSGPSGLVELRDALRANGLNYRSKFVHACAEPFKLLFRDSIMLRIARLDVGFFQFLEAGTVRLYLARPRTD